MLDSREMPRLRQEDACLLNARKDYERMFNEQYVILKGQEACQKLFEAFYSSGMSFRWSYKENEGVTAEIDPRESCSVSCELNLPSNLEGAGGKAKITLYYVFDGPGSVQLKTVVLTL